MIQNSKILWMIKRLLWDVHKLRHQSKKGGGGCKLKYDRGDGKRCHMTIMRQGVEEKNLSQHYNIKVIHESHQIYPLTKK